MRLSELNQLIKIGTNLKLMLENPAAAASIWININSQADYIKHGQSVGMSMKSVHLGVCVYLC